MYKLASEDDVLVAGTDIVKIEGWGDIIITLDCKVTPEIPTGKWPFVLYNIAHVPSFTTNVVSYNRFYDARIFWDSENLCVKYEGVIIGKTARKYSQWLLEYNPMDTAMIYWA